MRPILHWLQAAAQARATAEPHQITYIDFLTVTLTAMCALLAVLGFIVAALAVIGYRDIKAAAMRAAKRAGEEAIESKLKEYPDATEIHNRFNAMDRYMADIVRREQMLSQIRAPPINLAKSAKTEQDKPAKRPSRYPKKGD